ncbi:nitroreductase family protein [Candidatus Micrarchaeota archaeon]|nr:nitroreductase family protein [Candidatus Micrarchaeota archaeon]
MECIMKRRSIRKYTDKAVDKELVEKLLSAGMAAPSAVNEQPWKFLVVDDKEKLNRIADVHVHGQMLRSAAVAIIVCGDLDLRKRPDYWVQDCSACTQNILLAATDSGLGSVWTALYPSEERIEAVRKLFGIPKNIVPFCIIPLGYPNEEKPKKEGYDGSRVEWNEWK